MTSYDPYPNPNPDPDPNPDSDPDPDPDPNPNANPKPHPIQVWTGHPSMEAGPGEQPILVKMAKAEAERQVAVEDPNPKA